MAKKAAGKIPAKLTKKLQAFLAEKSRSTGGWAAVRDGDLEALYEILHLIVAAKYELDPDGDLPINSLLIDRTKCWPMHFSPVPYEHKAKSQAELDHIVRICLRNLELAMHSFQNATRERQEEYTE